MAVAIWFLGMAVLGLAYRDSDEEPSDTVVNLGVFILLWAGAFDILLIISCMGGGR